MCVIFFSLSLSFKQMDDSFTSVRLRWFDWMDGWMGGWVGGSLVGRLVGWETGLLIDSWRRQHGRFFIFLVGYLERKKGEEEEEEKEEEEDEEEAAEDEEGEGEDEGDRRRKKGKRATSD